MEALLDIEFKSSNIFPSDQYVLDKHVQLLKAGTEICGCLFCLVTSFGLGICGCFWLNAHTALATEKVIESCAGNTRVLQLTETLGIIGFPTRVFGDSSMGYGRQE